MKITKEHFNALKQSILALPTSQVLAHYKEMKKAGHTDRRFYFDVLYATTQYDLIAEIYKYANDDHIYTALKKILQFYIKENSILLES